MCKFLIKSGLNTDELKLFIIYEAPIIKGITSHILISV